MRNKTRQPGGFYIIAAGLLVLAGGFFLGAGIENSLSQKSEAEYRTVLKEGTSMDKLISDALAGVYLEEEAKGAQGQKRIELRMSNNGDNRYSCTFTLLEDQSGSILYQSGSLDPGYYVESLELEKALPSGIYSCTMLLEFYDGDYKLGEGGKKMALLIEE